MTIFYSPVRFLLGFCDVKVYISISISTGSICKGKGSPYNYYLNWFFCTRWLFCILKGLMFYEIHVPFFFILNKYLVTGKHFFSFVLSYNFPNLCVEVNNHPVYRLSPDWINESNDIIAVWYSSNCFFVINFAHLIDLWVPVTEK